MKELLGNTFVFGFLCHAIGFVAGIVIYKKWKGIE